MFAWLYLNTNTPRMALAIMRLCSAHGRSCSCRQEMSRKRVSRLIQKMMAQNKSGHGVLTNECHQSNQRSQKHLLHLFFSVRLLTICFVCLLAAASVDHRSKSQTTEAQNDRSATNGSELGTDAICRTS